MTEEPDALRAKARALLDGGLNEREFLGWLHRHVGHSGREDLQDLVEMDDTFTLGGTVDGDAWFDSSPEAAVPRRYVRDSARHIVNDEPVPPASP